MSVEAERQCTVTDDVIGLLPMNSNLEIVVARLAGYLSGVVAVDGDIRHYTAGAFVVSDERSADSPEAMIRDFYAEQTTFEFASSQKLEHGLGDLERQLGGYLIRRPWGSIEQSIPKKAIDDRRAFLAFRIMDMISDMAPEARNLRCVYKLETSASESDSRVTFFCVRIAAGFLVLQFNDDSPFVRAHRHVE
jgi:hypothetical protein